MKKKLISFLQFLMIFAGIGVYFWNKIKKKHSFVHIVSEPHSILKYDIQYLSKDKIRFNNEIKILLSEIHDALKVDLVQSDIYNFNKHDCTPYLFKFPYAFQILRIYKDVFFHSDGLCDPTLEFFLKKIRDKDIIIHEKNFEKTKYQNLFWESKPFIGFDYIMINNNRLKKLKSEVRLNLDQLIRSCQAKNLSDLLKSKSINDFYFVLNHEIVTNGYRDGKKKYWKAVYSVPVKITNKKLENIDDPEGQEVAYKTKKVEIIFLLKDKSISVLNNTEALPSLENFYVEDLEEFKKCEEEMKLYIKQCNFVFYKHQLPKNKAKPFYKFLTSKSDLKNKILFDQFFKLKKKDKHPFLNFVWTTDRYEYQPFANYSTEDLIEFLHTQSFEKKIKVQKNLEDIKLMENLELEMKIFFDNFLNSDEYKNNLYKKYEIETGKEESDDKKFSNIQLKSSKNVLINHQDGEIFYPNYVCGFVISDNPILSKCLSLACSMNDFFSANEIFEKFKNHQCEYFVLYRDEEKNLTYRCSKQLKVKIDNYRYSISL
ncbi:MAG: hypothetical protein LBD32_01335 [Cytophagales bacterium]|jgi:hypothetical protein|nr:hypothetical protein [Cytophagales bacterium]